MEDFISQTVEAVAVGRNIIAIMDIQFFESSMIKGESVLSKAHHCCPFCVTVLNMRLKLPDHGEQTR